MNNMHVHSPLASHITFLIRTDGSGLLQLSGLLHSQYPSSPPLRRIHFFDKHTHLHTYPQPPTADLNGVLCFLNCQIKHVSPFEYDTHMPAAI